MIRNIINIGRVIGLPIILIMIIVIWPITTLIMGLSEGNEIAEEFWTDYLNGFK